MNMKRIYNLIVAGLVVLFLASCGGMDENYKEFLVPNGIIYPGKATSPVARSGKERIMLEWERGNDPKVTGAKVYWNNYTESIDVDIPADITSKEKISQLIEPLAENNYTFVIQTYDADGNMSVPVELSGNVYGAVYLSGLFPRSIKKEYIKNTVWNIEWAKADLTAGALGSELVYEQENGDFTSLIIPVDMDATQITGQKPGGEYRLRTLFLPDSFAIDTFASDFQINKIPQEVLKLSTAGWVATADHWAPNQGLGGVNGAEGAIPAKTIDGDLNSFWHTAHNAQGMPAGGTYPTNYPHWLAYDMGKEYEVVKVELTPRPTYANQSFLTFIIQGSPDGKSWTNCGSFTLEGVNGKTQTFELPMISTMRHIRIYMTTGVNQHAHLAEFAVYGYE